MKRYLALFILLSLPALQAADKMVDIISKVVKNTAVGVTPAKDRLKTIGSVCFGVSGFLYLVATYQERVKFRAIVDSHKSFLDTTSSYGKDQQLDIFTLSQKEGAHNIWSGAQTLATCGLVVGAGMLGMSLEDTFDLV